MDLSLFHTRVLRGLRAATYVRTSNCNVCGIEQQTRVVLSFCQRQDLTVADEPAFQRLLDMATRSPFDVIVVHPFNGRRIIMDRERRTAPEFGSDRSPRSRRGQRVTISYPVRRATPHRHRRVIYIRHGEQPITDAEIEIMRLHLDGATMAFDPREVANDI